MNLPINQLSKEDLAGIKVICFDGDGVTKKKGTEFRIENGQQQIVSYPPTLEMLEQLKRLTKYFHITFSSGRALDYLQNIYGEIIKTNGSLQAEIGMYLWWKDEVFQNFEISSGQKEKLIEIRGKLAEIQNSKIIGFEPKEYLITLHCRDRVEEVEKIVAELDKENELYCWWNEEAYDIGLKEVNKGSGLQKLTEKLGVKMSEVMTVGNGINDKNMTDIVGIDVSTDPKHLLADFVVWGEDVGGKVVVDRVLKIIENG